MIVSAAIIYDFDGTLSPGSMQEHSFIPGLGYSDVQAFWSEVRVEAQRHDADPILTYMQLMLAKSAEPFSRQDLAKHGASLPLFTGVEEWFNRTNTYAAPLGLTLEHYVVSSGLREMIESSRVAQEFTHIFASGFNYGDDGFARWPAVAINYTGKTQFLFRISKGIKNSWDDSVINRRVLAADRQVPFDRIIFIGDGDTDIPSMETVRSRGGAAIAVFSPDDWRNNTTRLKVENLIAEERASYVAPADYSEGSQLDVTVRGILGRIAHQAQSQSKRSTVKIGKLRDGKA